MQSSIALSVIIPVYNVEAYLRRCLDSIIRQTFVSYEVIIVNDGSTDGSESIINEYRDKDKRIRILTQENRGLSEARNAGLNVACGEYVAFIDSDDYVDHTMFQKMMQQVIEQDADIVVCQFYKVSLSRECRFITEEVKHSFENMLASKLYAVAWNKIYKKSLFVDNQIRYPAKLYHEDVATTFKLYYYAKRILHVKEGLYYWQERESSISNHITLKHIDDFFTIFTISRLFLVKHRIYEKYKKEYLRRCCVYVGQLVKRIQNARLDTQQTAVLEQSIVDHLDQSDYLSDENFIQLLQYDLMVAMEMFNYYLNKRDHMKDVEVISGTQIEHKKEVFATELGDESVINYLFSDRLVALLHAIEDLKKRYKKIALYGIGTIGKLILPHLSNHVCLIVDKYTNEKSYGNIPVLSPENLNQYDYDVIVITVFGREKEVLSYLETLNLKNNTSYTFSLINNHKPAFSVQKNFYEPLVSRLNHTKPVIGAHPLNIQIQTVSHCNATCYFCPYHGSWHDKNPGRMSMEMYIKIIDNLKEYRIKKFCPYLENEPLLDANLFEKIAYAIEVLKPEMVEVATNISVLNEKMIQGLRDVLMKVPHELRVSFHGIDEASYTEVMGLDFHKSLNNVKKLVEIMQKEPLNLMIRGSGKPRRESSLVKFWFGKDDYHAFWNNELAEFDKKPKIDFFTYHDRASQKQLTHKGVDFNVYREDLKDFYCVRFDQWVHFLYTGEPILCCMDYNRETVFPDGISTKTIEELYASDHFTTMLKKATGLIESEKDFICKRCISPGG